MIEIYMMQLHEGILATVTLYTIEVTLWIMMLHKVANATGASKPYS